jgi:serine protease
VTGPPPGVTNLQAVVTSSGLKITWANPANSRYRYTVVRIAPSGTPAGLSPIAGDAVFAGTGTTAVATGLRPGQAYTVVSYTVDQYGNVSTPVESSVTF